MSPSARMAPSLAADWPRIAARIRASCRVIVFLDFDGTLVTIAPQPDQVRLAPAARRALRRLARHPRASVFVISGRRRAELLHYIGVPGIRYFGLYGWERSGRAPLPRATFAALRIAEAELSRHLSSVPGLWVENKKISLSVHFLGVPKAEKPRARRKLRSLLLPFQKSLRAIENIRDVEIVPRCILGKGAAVKELLVKPGRCPALAIYIGDDLSDEPAFEAVGEHISIRVGAPRPTRARYSVRGPGAVVTTLTKLEAALN